MTATVVVHFDERGEQTYHVSGDGVQFYIVDERAPGDRVYEWLPRVAFDAIDAILGDDPIGSSADDRHEAVKHKILRALDGKSHLEPVK